MKLLVSETLQQFSKFVISKIQVHVEITVQLPTSFCNFKKRRTYAPIVSVRDFPDGESFLTIKGGVALEVQIRRNRQIFLR